MKSGSILHWPGEEPLNAPWALPDPLKIRPSFRRFGSSAHAIADHLTALFDSGTLSRPVKEPQNRLSAHRALGQLGSSAVVESHSAPLDNAPEEQFTGDRRFPRSSPQDGPAPASPNISPLARTPARVGTTIAGVPMTTSGLASAGSASQVQTDSIRDNLVPSRTPAHEAVGPPAHDDARTTGPTAVGLGDLLRGSATGRLSRSASPLPPVDSIPSDHHFSPLRHNHQISDDQVDKLFAAYFRSGVPSHSPKRNINVSLQPLSHSATSVDHAAPAPPFSGGESGTGRPDALVPLGGALCDQNSLGPSSPDSAIGLLCGAYRSSGMSFAEQSVRVVRHRRRSSVARSAAAVREAKEHSKAMGLAATTAKLEKVTWKPVSDFVLSERSAQWAVYIPSAVFVSALLERWLEIKKQREIRLRRARAALLLQHRFLPVVRLAAYRKRTWAYVVLSRTFMRYRYRRLLRKTNAMTDVIRCYLLEREPMLLVRFRVRRVFKAVKLLQHKTRVYLVVSRSRLGLLRIQLDHTRETFVNSRGKTAGALFDAAPLDLVMYHLRKAIRQRVFALQSYHHAEQSKLLEKGVVSPLPRPRVKLILRADELQRIMDAIVTSVERLQAGLQVDGYAPKPVKSVVSVVDDQR